MNMSGPLRLWIRRCAALALLAASLQSPSALAQATTGSIFGTAPAQPGQTVLIENLSTGLSRTADVGTNGRFEAPALPVGNYRVTLFAGDQHRGSQTASVKPGTGSLITFDAGGTVEVLDEISVTGVALTAIDVSSSETTTVFSAERMKQLPIAQDITSVALLAPGVTRGDEDFGNLASFAGASVAENSYYVNGFNVTNLFQNLDFSQVPFDAIQSQEIKLGGYGARYGRSTGGVINVVTHSGGNTWEFGGSVFHEPASLRGNKPTILDRNGNVYRSYDRNEQSVTSSTLWGGGPLIRDRLFLYAVAEFENQTETRYNNRVAAFGTDTEDRSPFLLTKLDWNLDESQRLELTAFQDKTEATTDFYNVAYNDGRPDKIGYTGTQREEFGGPTYILRYTTFLGSDINLSALAGYSTYNRKNRITATNGLDESYNGVIGDFNQPGCPSIVDLRDATLAGGDPITACSVLLDGSGVRIPDARDTKRILKLDGEWRLEPQAQWLGRHRLSAGYENELFRSKNGETIEGGAEYEYFTGPDANGDPVEIVERIGFQTSATVEVETDSFYIEDAWQATDTLLLSLGLRNDSFDNRNGQGQTYVKQDNIWQPRLGFSWDILGDSSMKLYGNYGQYSLPIASGVALRGASASIYVVQDFTYDSIDPVTGEPQGLQPAPDTGDYFVEPFFINGQNGSTPNPASVASAGLKPYSQDEIILGLQMQVDALWTAGLRGTYRDLTEAIDDTCDVRPIFAFAEANGFDNDGEPGYGYADYPLTNPSCFLFNPGSDLVVDLDLDGDGQLETVALPASAIGQPDARRKYLSLELTAERRLHEHWYLLASYTWAHSYGNTEGLVKSDINQDDTGTTQDFDFPELMEGAYGNLPNDRRHSFKLFGAYAFLDDQFLVGANLLLQSGRPRNCIGASPADQGPDGEYGTDDDVGYSSSYFYCDGNPNSRGSAGNTGVLWNLDLSLQYKPYAISGLRATLDIFNVLDGDAATQFEDRKTTGSFNANGGNRRINYDSPSGFQEPRSVRIGIEYQFGL